MPITSAAKKAMRQSQRRARANRVLKDHMKEAMKTFFKLVKTGKTEEAKKELGKAYALIDKAAKRHLFHKNNTARKKSRLARMLWGKPTVSPT